MRKRITRGPFLVAALFVVLIASSLGFVVYFPMLFTFVANHYVYLGLIPLAAGVAGILHWGLGAVGEGGVCGGGGGGVAAGAVDLEAGDAVAGSGGVVGGDGGGE